MVVLSSVRCIQIGSCSIPYCCRLCVVGIKSFSYLVVIDEELINQLGYLLKLNKCCGDGGYYVLLVSWYLLFSVKSQFCDQEVEQLMLLMESVKFVGCVKRAIVCQLQIIFQWDEHYQLKDLLRYQNKLQYVY
eukprot:TRINITY_DN1895_c0_g1_i1.p3 TRINITY_DN1895_c0_g1~~TRINITY_DN1895_c0_g1_i1.p3  ORF type:complete len:133 (-),score=4.19 TRINITY_DN1895_c0_g1_i1:38-436(-)